jgi:hypothetical protein
MRKYFDVVFYTTSIPVAGALVFVTDQSGNLVTLYSDDGVTPTDNPLTTDSTGFYSFYVADGVYNLQYMVNGVSLRNLTDVQIFDESNFSSSTPQILKSVNLTSQSGNIAPTTFYTVPATGAGMYRATVDLIITTGGGTGDITIQIGNNNGIVTNTQTFDTVMSTSTAGNENGGPLVFYAAAGTPITYGTTMINVTTGSVYTLRVRLEYLG